MSTNFPTSLDSLTNPIGTDKVNNAVTALKHSVQHTNVNDAIEAIEAKVGIDGSAVTTTHDYKLSTITSTNKAVAKAVGAFTGGKLMISNGTDSITETDLTLSGGELGLDSGGTGTSLSDPNADRLLGWDNTGNVMNWITPGSGLSLASNTLIATSANLIQTLTAAEDLAAGTPVGISNLVDNSVAKAAYISRTATVPSTAGEGKMINIGTDKVAYLYNKTATSEMWLVIGTLNTSTNAFTFGTPVQITGAVTSVENSWDITKLDTDVFAITYAETATATECKLVIGTISGTTITLGTPQTAVTVGGNVTGNSICTLSTTKGVISYMVNADKVYSIAFTVSGTVATFGSAVAASASLASGQIKSVKLDTDKFVVVSSGYGQVGTLSGTAITMGSALQIQALVSGSRYMHDIIQVTTDKFLYKAPNGSATLVTACTVSGTTITAGSASTQDNGSSGLIYLSDSEIYIRGTSSASPVLRKLTLSGTTITEVGIVINRFSTAGTLNQTLVSMGSYWIAVAVNTTTLTFFVLGMANGFIGFAQTSVSKGGSVVVIVRGEDSNQSGLIPGSTYSVSQGALTFRPDNSSVSTLADVGVVKAVSATKIIY